MTLQIENLHVQVAGKPVLQGLTLALDDGAAVSLIGPPGCGKSTLLRALAGLQPVSEGRIVHGGVSLAGRPVEARLRAGIVFVAQGGRVFRGMTVQDNLAIAQSGCRQAGVAADVGIALRLFPRLVERRAQSAASLSGGERQMLALGMAMISRPRLLLLDEPSGGLSPINTGVVLERVREFARESGAAVLVVEQNIRNALAAADRVAIIHRGVVAHDGVARSAEELRALADRYAFAADAEVSAS